MAEECIGGPTLTITNQWMMRWRPFKKQLRKTGIRFIWLQFWLRAFASKALLSLTVYTWVYCIAMQFGSTYIGTYIINDKHDTIEPKKVVVITGIIVPWNVENVCVIVMWQHYLKYLERKYISTSKFLGKNTGSRFFPSLLSSCWTSAFKFENSFFRNVTRHSDFCLIFFCTLLLSQ